MYLPYLVAHHPPLSMVIHEGGAYTSGSLLGDQWRQVQEWPEANEEAESDASYETEEEDVSVAPSLMDMRGEPLAHVDKVMQIYVTLDLGPNVDRSVMASAMEYQLIVSTVVAPFICLVVITLSNCISFSVPTGSRHSHAISQNR